MQQLPFEIWTKILAHFIIGIPACVKIDIPRLIMEMNLPFTKSSMKEPEIISLITKKTYDHLLFELLLHQAPDYVKFKCVNQFLDKLPDWILASVI